MRAREPDRTGYVDRDGVRIAYESFGEGDTTILFPPVDPIVHSQMWKAQVPYLSRHYRVVTVDPRGNGRSDRPTEPAAYDDLEFVGDAIAVMDELGIERAVLASVCYSAWLALLTASLHPERVQGVVAIAPYVLDGSPPMASRADAAARFEEDLPSNDGWYKMNRHYWLARLAGLRGVLLRPDLLRAALHQGVRGRRRLRPRHHGRGDGGQRAGPGLRPDPRGRGRGAGVRRRARCS